MKRLEKDKLGRVTFLPLNRLRIDRVQYPESPDVKPLLQQCIRFDAKIERAMQHVFGKKLLSRSVDAASAWSSKCNMDAITLEGDLCSRKGALTGGYMDLNKSRLRAHGQQVAAQEALKKAETAHQEINRKAQATDQSVTNLMGELQRMEAKQADFNHTISENEAEIDRIASRLENQTKQIEKIEKTTIPTLQNEISSVEADISRLTEEIGTDLTSTLSEEDRGMLTQLKKIQVELASEMESQTEVVAKVSLERQKLQSLLEDNLMKRRQELLDEGVSAEGDARRRSRGGANAQEQRWEDLEQRQRELDDATRISDDLEARLAEARKVDNELRAELIANKGDLEKLRSTDMQNARALEDAQELAERLLNKVSNNLVSDEFNYLLSQAFKNLLFCSS
jgi:structural maintenance of chromosome 3 (chondroitin sulfate proteoglycan 6)